MGCHVINVGGVGFLCDKSEIVPGREGMGIGSTMVGCNVVPAVYMGIRGNCWWKYDCKLQGCKKNAIGLLFN